MKNYCQESRKFRSVQGKKQLKGKVFLILFFFIMLGGWSTLRGLAAEALSAADHSGKLKGQLVDKDTHALLPGATVTIRRTGQQTVTDSRGEFIFEKLEVGTHSLQFELPDVKPFSKTDIVVKSRKVTYLQIEMEILPILAETVTVRPEYFSETRQQPVSKISWSAEEIRRSAGGIGDISRMVTSLPSVAKIGDDSNCLVVRGGNPAENKYYVDNIEMPNINHFPIPGSTGGHINLLNIDFIQDVNFYSGGFSSQYGDALSSVMDITYRQGNRENFSGQANMNMAGFYLGVEGPLGKKGSFLFSANRSYLDLLMKIVAPGENTVVPRYGDLQGKMIYEFSPRNRLTFLAVIGDDRIEFPKETAIDFGSTDYGRCKYSEGTVGLNWFYSWGNIGYSETSLSYSFTNVNFNFQKTIGDALNYNGISAEKGTVLRNVNHFRLNPLAKIILGIEVKNLFNSYTNDMASYHNELGIVIPAASWSFNPNINKYNMFGDLSLQLLERLTINLGMRGDYFSYNKHFLVSPRFSMCYQLSGQASLVFSAGLFQQSLPVILLGKDNLRRTDLKDPAAIHLTLGLNHLFTDNTRLTVELFDKEYHHLPLDPNEPGLFLFDRVREGGFVGNSRLLDTGRAYARGVEISIQKKLREKIYGMINASYSRTRYRDMNGSWRNRVFENRLMFTIEGGYKPNQKVEYSMRWMYAGGTPYTPFDLPFSQALNMGIFDQSRINSERRPPYHTLNVRYDRRFYFKHANLTFFMSIWNIYNRKNVADYYWDVIKKAPAWQTQWTLMPVGGVQFEF